jgi:two-component system sensor histidine kinase PilS (NtrC family)
MKPVGTDHGRTGRASEGPTERRKFIEASMNPVGANPVASTARSVPAAGEDAWGRLRHLSDGRLLLAVLLCGLLLLDLHRELVQSDADARLFAAVVIAYLTFSIVWAFTVRRWRVSLDRQLAAQIGIDLLLLTLLTHATGGARGGFALLLIADVAGAALLMTSIRAAFIAALASLLVLGEAIWRLWAANWQDAGQLTPAAMVGVSCFAIALLVNWLATRLAAQQALAVARGQDLRSQLEIMRMVISEISQGVVIVDSRGVVRTMNRTAQTLLGQTGPWPQIEGMTQQWLQEQDEIETTLSCSDPANPGQVLEHSVRIRLLRLPEDHRSDTVLLIEDLRQVEERAQQLKLASMGRLSASIAHEIRNPLAAIRHANSLLAERVDGGMPTRLAQIVEDSSVRINRIVEDVLSIARRERPATELIDMKDFLERLVAEFFVAERADLARIRIAVLTDEPMSFDPRHLRQVLENLLANALRYASSTEAAIRLEWRGGQGHRLEFRVLDDGPGLDNEVLTHVFEPFFTTDSRGVGLGLFLAREFCTANRAALRYERQGSSGRYSGAFVIVPGQGERV